MERASHRSSEGAGGTNAALTVLEEEGLTRRQVPVERAGQKRPRRSSRAGSSGTSEPAALSRLSARAAAIPRVAVLRPSTRARRGPEIQTAGEPKTRSPRSHPRARPSPASAPPPPSAGTTPPPPLHELVHSPPLSSSASRTSTAAAASPATSRTSSSPPPLRRPHLRLRPELMRGPVALRAKGRGDERDCRWPEGLRGVRDPCARSARRTGLAGDCRGGPRRTLKARSVA